MPSPFTHKQKQQLRNVIKAGYRLMAVCVTKEIPGRMLGKKTNRDIKKPTVSAVGRIGKPGKFISRGFAIIQHLPKSQIR